LRKPDSLLNVSILKNEKSLNDALRKIEQLKNEMLPQMTAQDAHYLLKWIEVQAIAFVAELYLRTSLMRKETRAGHFREDFPDRNNEKWLCWIIAKRQGDHISFRTEPVPLERYEIKPDRYYMDNFNFPKIYKG
jgi:succinate dehydrogenase / fumarate reductase flavoprotein subunit